MSYHFYRELYGLNEWMDVLKENLSHKKESEIYALKPLGVGFIEINASSKDELQQIDQQCSSQIIAFCENQKIENHSLGPLKTLYSIDDHQS